jgi:hypothetical protein
MGQVASVLTPATAGQVIGALMAAGLTRTAANVAAAQSADETAAWAAMHNWNMGNITVPSPSTADWMLQGSNPLHFASYASLLDGAKAMVNWLQTRNVPLTGDIPSYVAALQAHCYLGCVGSGTVTQTDYTNYQAAINRYLPTMEAATPISPPWSLTTWLVVGTSTGIIGYGLAQHFYPRETERLLRRVRRMF